MGASLPDGTLLIRALETGVQAVAKENSQASFRLAQSHAALQVDEMPQAATIWDFSQCLLAEAETLVLMSSSATSTTDAVPLKLKVMETGDNAVGKKAPMEVGSNGKGRGGAIDDPCRWFKTDTGCRAGKQCKWQHSWEGITDKNARCWNCGSKAHRKQDCPVKGGGSRPKDETKVSGGGLASSSSATPATPTSKPSPPVTPIKPKVNEMSNAATSTTSTTASPGELKSGNPGSEGDDITKSLGDGGTGGEQAGQNGKTAELLHEATQLLKTLRIPPKLNVMRISELDRGRQDLVLVDSGATHALRPARDDGEWGNGQTTTVMLAEGSTNRFRLKPGTRILLSEPGAVQAWIVPMGGLADLDFTMQWSGNQCQLRDDEGREIEVLVQHGCPMISLADGQRVLEWLELFQVHQQRKMAMVKTFIKNPEDLNPMKLDLELAMTVKLQQLFPGVPEEIMMKLVPRLEAVKSEMFGSMLPWNRHKRRRLQKAKHVVLHVFSGDNPQYWERQLSTANTEVLCVDLQGGCHANLLDKHVYGFLLTIAASGKLRALLGGPPCRTVSALRSQGDGGPGELRTEEHPYGLPTLSMADMEKVQNDSILFFRFLSLYAVAKEVQLPSDPSPQLILEQPRDPKEYRPPEDLNRNNYMSMFRTAAWKRFAEVFELYKIDFDQGPMGHERRKPTTLFTTMEVLLQLDGIHGAPEHPPQDLREQPLQKRMEASKRWAAWAPGLKQALVVAIRQHLQELEYERAAQDQGAERSDQRARHASVQPLQEGPGQSNNQISVQSLEPDSIQQQDETMEVNQRGYQSQRPEGSQRPPMAKALGPVALEQWKRHFLNDHLPARRDCSHCVRAQGRSKPHRRIQHPAAYTLSVDLSGRMTPGDDQQMKACKYLLVGCYTYPVTRDGRSLVQVPGKPDEDVDVPLPGPDAEMSDAEEPQDLPEDVLLEEEDVETEAVESPATRRAKSMNETWKKLIEQAENVTVRQLTFVEPVKSRSVKHLLPALSKVHARIRAMGLPIYRIHSDRAREFSSAEMQSWALDRNILTTMTSGSSYKANGRVEAEMGMVKKSIRTLITAGVCTLSQWPLAARHIGERRLRSQLNLLGWPVGRLLRFGAKAYALRKSWQSRYAPWREVREPVIILGPDAHASLTNTGYFVKSVDTGRCFYTDDIVVPDVQQPAVEDQVLYLPERLDDAPQRRHRTKAPLPAISMLDIEGEEKIVNRFPEMFEPTTPSHHGGSSDSWSMCTVTSSHESSWTPKSIEVEEEGWCIGGGDEEGAPNSQDGGSSLTASNNASMTNPAALRALHVNLTHYVEDEMAVLDGTAAEQSLWLGNVTEAIKMKAMIEEQLTEAQAHGAGELQKKLEQEFLVTKTIGNAEVWADLDAWSDSIRQEYDQLVNKKQAVRQITKAQLQQMASEMKLPIEILPGKMVHTRKSGSGAYRSRAVICGNYAGPDNNEHYAGGVDGQQVRAMVRLGALKQWQIGCTDIRTAFLNAPRRDTKRLIAMEIPSVFRKLQLAGHQDLWLVDKALYGLTTSPRDWGLHRDEVLPTVSWCRQREGRDVRGILQEDTR